MLTKNRFLSPQPLKGRMCNEGSHRLVDSLEPREQLTFIFWAICLTTVRWKDVSDSWAVVGGGAGGTIAPPEFGVLEKRTERERNSLLQADPQIWKFNNSSVSHKFSKAKYLPGQSKTLFLWDDDVHISWEGLKILRNLYLTFDWHYMGQK